MHYIYDFNKFITERKHDIPHGRKTGNEIAYFLGKNEKEGREIFRTINENVENLEKLIDEFNEKHESKLKKSPLEVKIDKTKLDLEYLISKTKLRKTPFITDVIIGNILNYKILIRPIKNARIISIAYRYYLALLRHALQQSLISIEMASDLFFTQINASLAGRRKQMKTMLENLVDNTQQAIIETFTGRDIVDPKTGKVTNIKKMMSTNNFRAITQLVKHQATINNSLNQYDRSFGYNQNVFQDFGRSLESQIKSSQDKEIQALGDKLQNYANSTTGLTKESAAGAKEQVSTYAQSIKLSVEARAMEISEQIYANMLEIIKIFSLRNIDGFSEVFDTCENINSNEEKWQDTLDKVEKKHKEEINMLVKKLTGNATDIMMTEEEKQTILDEYKKRGIDSICTPLEFKNVFEPGKDIKTLLKNKGFSSTQIDDILDKGSTVQEYGKIYYEDIRNYIDKYGENYGYVIKWSLSDNKNKNDDDLYCWARKDSLKYKELKNQNTKKQRDKYKQ